MLRLLPLAFLIACNVGAASPTPASPTARPARHTFALGPQDFLLDGAPFHMISCELHPSRIPVEYWTHRIQMAKAMGCNTISIYVFWSYHEASEGTFDFSTGNRDLARFIRAVEAEGMWMLVRPGPYVCAEWDFGGLPTYLLEDPELRIRSRYPRYLAAAERYMAELAKVIRPALVTRGGPVLMVQVENEYGSYSNDRAYLERLREVWRGLGVDVPFFTGDGPTPHMLEAGTLPGAAVGLDPGKTEEDFALARAMNPGVPVFSSETYPGWLTHWGEPWQAPPVEDLLAQVRFLMSTKKSFNLYVAHGGTNFGFTAGANSGGKGYEPDVTSYDYDAPIDEQGNPTAKYHALRELIGSFRPAGQPLPPVPEPVPAIAIPEFPMQAAAGLWDVLPPAIAEVHPRPFEHYGQNQGLVLYRTTLVGRKHGRLLVTDLHDFGVVLVDGKLVGTIDRRLGQNSIELPVTQNPRPVLDVLVEGMGHINFAEAMLDRKGITERVSLGGMTLTNWQVHRMPLDEPWVAKVARTTGGAAPDPARPGRFYRGSFALARPADTFLDLSGYRKGVVWVNGHNLGRYWDIGPQERLYCPASWLRAGTNEVVVLDLLQTDAAPLRGAATLK